MRVFELAQALTTTSSDLLRQAEALGLDAHSPLSRLSDEEIAKVRACFKNRSASEIECQTRERQVRLKAKTETENQRRDAQFQKERETLLANAERAKEFERRAKGLPASPAQAQQAPSAAETAATTPPIPVAKSEPVATHSAPVVNPPVAASSIPEPKKPSQPAPAATDMQPSKAAQPQKASTVKPAAAAQEKPRADKPRVKGPRRPGSEEEIDPDEALMVAYVGPQTIRAASSRIEKPRKDSSEQSIPRGRFQPPSRGGSQSRFVSAAPPAPLPTAQPSAATTTSDRVLLLRGAIMVKELAEMLGLRPNRLIADLMQLNVLASINQRVELDLAGRIAAKYGYTVELERARRSTERKPVLRRDDADDAIPDDKTENLVPRPPVVTFLGHVDHGKTSLMDRIRNADVAAGEAGGITQHIGAYTVDVNGRKITFLDTPGHAAFSAMRARGASLTDVAVIIVAGDDGVMPQTKEAIRHAKQANVQILVAINKCDLPQAKPERVKQQLQAEGLTPEDWGGDVVCCEVSAVTGKGVDHLLEMILLQADVLELSANPNRRADGYVIEAQLEQGRGPTATLLVSGGTLNVGDIILCGDYFGRIRALMDDRGRMVKSCGPSIAVKCMGLSGVPEAGSPFRVMLNEKRARDLAEKLAEERKHLELATSKATSLDALMSQIKDEARLEMNIIVKADTQGSIEAIVDSLKEIKSEKVSLNIISSHTGNVTANDIQRAAAGHAMIVGFQVACESGVQSLARHDGVHIHTFRIIYELFDHVKQEMLKLLAPEYRENVRGHALVKTVFDLSRKGKIAGCQVSDGIIRTDSKIRIFRQRQVVYNGRLASLRHFQNEVAEVKEPSECGMRFENFDSFAEGDYIECYALEEMPRIL